MPNMRWFAMPPIFNFKRSTLYPRNYPAHPVMLHTHTFSYEHINCSNYQEMARVAAYMIVDDGYHHMLPTAVAYGFMCGMMAI